MPSHVFSYPAVFHPIVNDLERRFLGRDSKKRDDIRVPKPLPHNNPSIKSLPAQALQPQFSEINNIRTNLAFNVRSQSFDADLFPIEFRLVRISGTSDRQCFPSIKKYSAWDEVGPWENLAVAACTLQSAQSFSEEIVCDRSAVKRLVR